MATDLIAWSGEQQAAVFGHAFADPEIWERLDSLGVTKDWLQEQSLSACFHHVKEYQKYYNRAPGAEELVQYLSSDPVDSKAIRKVVDRCLKAANDLPVDGLLVRLRQWAKAIAMKQGVLAVADAYKKGDHDKAGSILIEAANKIEWMDHAAGGSPDSMAQSTERFKTEKAVRMGDKDRILSYGVDFLNDILGGIIPTDFVLVGAQTGVGKTELAKIIALHNAKQKKRVIVFALEAEEDEWERRIKFGMQAQLWKLDNPQAPTGTCEYAAFRMGKLDKMLAPYEKIVDDDYEENYGSLRTYYKIAGRFGIKEMDREILKAKGNLDLIVLDHFHQVDLPGGANQNVEQKELSDRLRNFALGLRIPVVCVAHLRKEADGKLIGECNDFHGSSDINKIGTTEIMLAKAYDLASADARTSGGLPTFCRTVKNRLGGGRPDYTGLLFFDPESSCYKPYYAVGRVNRLNTKWRPLKANWPLWAKEERLIKDMSELG